MSRASNKTLAAVFGIILLLTASCKSPREYLGYHTFRPDTALDSALFDYSFHIEDTLSTYQICLALRFNALAFVPDTLQAGLTYTSPIDSTTHFVQVAVPLEDAGRITQSGSIVDIELPVGGPYAFGQPGKWSVKVCIDDKNLLPALRGVGYSYKKL